MLQRIYFASSATGTISSTLKPVVFRPSANFLLVPFHPGLVRSDAFLHLLEHLCRDPLVVLPVKALELLQALVVRKAAADPADELGKPRAAHVEGTIHFLVQGVKVFLQVLPGQLPSQQARASDSGHERPHVHARHVVGHDQVQALGNELLRSHRSEGQQELFLFVGVQGHPVPVQDLVVARQATSGGRLVHAVPQVGVYIRRARETLEGQGLHLAVAELHAKGEEQPDEEPVLEGALDLHGIGPGQRRHKVVPRDGPRDRLGYQILEVRVAGAPFKLPFHPFESVADVVPRLVVGNRACRRSSLARGVGQVQQSGDTELLGLHQGIGIIEEGGNVHAREVPLLGTLRKPSPHLGGVVDPVEARLIWIEHDKLIRGLESQLLELTPIAVAQNPILGTVV
mmetsp:Transcript_39219/g.83949  ORF Transcript_39219/g.83949 Transcript_39219/m.83949 type:complete len:399 (-) Transcript_39219:707-1903(-)